MKFNGYLSTKEAAEYLNVSTQQVWKLAKAGLIGSKMQGLWRFTKIELDEFVKGEKSNG